MYIDVWAIFSALPAIWAIASTIALGIVIYLLVTRAPRVSPKIVAEAAGLSSDRNLESDLRALAQKAKDKTREAEEKTKEATKANEDNAKLLAAIANLSVRPAGNVNQALTTLEVLAGVSSNMLEALIAAWPDFRTTMQNFQNAGGTYKGAFDVPEKVTGQYGILVGITNTAIHDKNEAVQKLENAKSDIASLNATIATLRPLAEAGKLGDAKKIAKLEGQKGVSDALQALAKDHTAQVIGLATAAVSSKSGGNTKNRDNGNQNRGNSNRNRDNGNRNRDNDDQNRDGDDQSTGTDG